MEASSGKTTMLRDQVLVAKIKKSEASCSMTTKGSKERLREHNEEEKKKMLQDLAQGLEQMFVKQNECVTTLGEEHNLRTLKRRRTLESDDTRDGQIMGVKMEALAHDISQDDCRISFGSGLGSFV